MSCSASHNLPVNIHFHGWLTELTKRVRPSNELLPLSLNRRTSIKDLIESLGVPHTEIGSILTNQEPVSFDHIIEQQCSVQVFPLHPPVNVLLPCLLRPWPLPAIRFLVDANVGKLAGKLRMAGLDTLYNQQWQDADLAEIAARDQCVLLSRDIQLLKRKNVVFGHFVRESNPDRQLAEIVNFYGLSRKLHPFSRCMRCNGLLAPVSKAEIMDQLQPLTRKYYHIFHRCESCRHVYWSGTHREPMEKTLRELNDYSPLVS